MVSFHKFRQSMPALPWLIWISAGLFYSFENLLQVSQGVMAHDLMRDFGITASGLSVINSAFFWSYALCQLPSGMLYDRFQTRSVLCMAMIICTGATYLQAHAHGLFLAGLARFFVGLGSAFAALGCLKLAQLWFKPNRFAMLTGLTLSLGMLGQMMGEAPLSLAMSHFGWQNTLIYLALIGLITTTIAWLFIQQDPKMRAQKQTSDPVKKQLLDLLKMPPIWLISVYGMLMFAPFLILGNLWGVQFLSKAYAWPMHQAAAHFSSLLIGFAIGAPLIGAFSDGCKRRRPFMQYSAMSCTILLTILIAMPLATWLLDGILFATGLAISAFLPAFSALKEISPKQSKSTALGLMNTLNSFGGALFVPLVGVLLDLFWSHHMINGAPSYALITYQKSLAICPILTLLAWIMSYFLPETFAKDKDEA